MSHSGVVILSLSLTNDNSYFKLSVCTVTSTVFYIPFDSATVLLGICLDLATGRYIKWISLCITVKNCTQ